jgi:hypothetical protein
MASKFEVLIAGVADNISAIVPSAQPRGLFWTTNTIGTDEEITAKLAAVDSPTLLGFNDREITTTGLRTEAQLLWNTGLEGYDKAGTQASIVAPPQLMAVEDDTEHTYISTTNPPTAAGDLVGFLAGKLHIGQTGEYVFYQVKKVNTGSYDATQNRFILELLNSPVKIA